jgi:hypothetical protein
MLIKGVYSMNNQCWVFVYLLELRIEKNIRSVFESNPNVTFKQGVELVNIEEDAENVTITYQDENGINYTNKVNNPTFSLIQGKFLVGADGKVGYVRKNFLEPKGVHQLDSEKYP